MWDLSTGKQMYTIEGYPGTVASLALSPDGTKLASATRWTNPFDIKIHDPRSGKELAILTGHKDGIHALAFSGNESLVSASSADIIKWDLRTKESKSTINLSIGNPSVVAFSPDLQSLVIGAGDGRIKHWKLNWKSPSRQDPSADIVLHDHTKGISAVAFSPDGKNFASGSADHTVKCWDPVRWTLRDTFEGHGGRIRSLAFSGNNILVSGSSDSTVRLWDVHAAEREPETLGREVGETVFSVAFSPDGKMLATGSVGEDLKDVQRVNLWNLQAGTKMPFNIQHTQNVFSVAYSPDGNRLAIGGAEGLVQLWQLDPETHIWTVRWSGKKEAAGTVYSIAFSPDGESVAAGLGVPNGTVRLFNATDGKPREGHIFPDMETVHQVVFSPDGKNVVASSKKDRAVLFWDLGDPTGKPKVIETGFVWSIALSPKGDTLVVGRGDGKVALWDVRSQQLLRVLKAHASDVKAVAVSPDGETLVTGDSLGFVKLWMWGNWKAIPTPLKGHNAGILDVAFPPPDVFRLRPMFASADASGTIKVWRAAAREEGQFAIPVK
jgi:WD40 repeat protein